VISCLSWNFRDIQEGSDPVDDDGGVLYLVVSGAPAPEGIPALVAACQTAGWRVVVFSTPTGIRFIDPAELERLTGEPVRSEHRMPATGKPVPLADAVLVTGDSANMVGEATATGSPVHIFEPSGGESKKRAGTIDALVRIGAARRFEGRLERFSYAPIDSSGVIAREIARRFLASRATAA